MNTFDYWFDYIVRNGKFLSEARGELGFSFVNKWEIKTQNFTYFAFFEANGSQPYILGKFNLDNTVNCILYKNQIENLYSYKSFYRELINHRNGK